MNSLEQSYRDNWKNLGTILTFRNNYFQFKSRIIIVELDQCLVKSMSQAKIYNTRNNYDFEIYEPDLIKKLQEASKDHSIIVLSNHINTNKLNIDIIKRKVEMVALILKIPIIGFFALKPNCFMKPHTGMWKLIHAYYRKYGNRNIDNAIVVSNEGGMIWEKKTRSGIRRTVAFRDIDRAFANNIGVKFKSIDEYLDDCQPLDYEWDRRIIAPEIRAMYVEQIKKCKNENVFQLLGQFDSCDIYVIMVMGAPRSGKTRLSNSIVQKWQNSPFGEMNEVERLGMDEYTNKRRYGKFKQLIRNRISVVIDGDCYSNDLRRPFLMHIRDKNIPVLLIEVRCGLQMSKVFNHAHVEQSSDMSTYVYKKYHYDIYRSARSIPTKRSKMLKYTLHMPAIDETQYVMSFRY